MESTINQEPQSGGEAFIGIIVIFMFLLSVYLGYKGVTYYSDSQNKPNRTNSSEMTKADADVNELQSEAIIKTAIAEAIRDSRRWQAYEPTNDQISSEQVQRLIDAVREASVGPISAYIAFRDDIRQLVLASSREDATHIASEFDFDVAMHGLALTLKYEEETLFRRNKTSVFIREINLDEFGKFVKRWDGSTHDYPKGKGDVIEERTIDKNVALVQASGVNGAIHYLAEDLLVNLKDGGVELSGFGSRVNGLGKPGSDLDLYIMVNNADELRQVTALLNNPVFAQAWVNHVRNAEQLYAEQHDIDISVVGLTTEIHAWIVTVTYDDISGLSALYEQKIQWIEP
jgi:hypothetical protein